MQNEGSLAEWSMQKAIAAQKPLPQVEKVPSELIFDNKQQKVDYLKNKLRSLE